MKEHALIDRLDIAFRGDSVLGFTSVKPLDRQTFTKRIEYIDSLDRAGVIPGRLTPMDRFDIRRVLMDNSEWTRNYQDSFQVRHPILKTFYKTKAHMYSVDTKDFELIADPVLYFKEGYSNDGVGNLYQNTRGLYLRGSIERKVGFYTYLSDNQERDPLYVQNYVNAHNGLPGEGFYKPYGTNGYDYFDFRGGITFDLLKVIHFQYAYDKLFIGDGYRSLFLSDFANDFVFARASCHLWILKYEMIIGQTIESVPQNGRDQYPKNYMMLHHLSAQVTKWLNLGFYENIMEDAVYGLNPAYIVPFIFYRGVEGDLGANGKANVGFDAKANLARHVQLYSQLLIDEFHANEILHYSRGYWANKQALQVGAKYKDAFTVHNLDLQLECNLIRPFTYMNFDSVTNFTHYNQPLAHPLGANVREFIALARYQPLRHLYVEGKIIHYLQGLDSGGVNYGSNIFLTYNTVPFQYGWHIGTGDQVHSNTLALNLSYEIFENTFLDFTATRRTYDVQGQPNNSVLFYTFAFRMNIQRRMFDF